jgi:hypothetical protein
MNIKMSLRQAVLDALADDDETIIQIQEYIENLKINASQTEIEEMTKELLTQGKIFIVYPIEVNVLPKVIKFSDLWFRMTKEGRMEWESIT